MPRPALRRPSTLPTQSAPIAGSSGPSRPSVGRAGHTAHSRATGVWRGGVRLHRDDEDEVWLTVTAFSCPRLAHACRRPARPVPATRLRPSLRSGPVPLVPSSLLAGFVASVRTGGRTLVIGGHVQCSLVTGLPSELPSRLKSPNSNTSQVVGPAGFEPATSRL